jgi:hypothetical protein
VSDIIVGTGEDGSDLAADDLTAKLLLRVRERRDAAWAVLCHSRIVVNVCPKDDPPYYKKGAPVDCTIYITEKYLSWWHQNTECWRAVVAATQDAWGVDENWAGHNMIVEAMLVVPQDLQHFVAENTGRPKPRRYNTTAVQLHERDGTQAGCVATSGVNGVL